MGCVDGYVAYLRLFETLATLLCRFTGNTSESMKP